MGKRQSKDRRFKSNASKEAAFKVYTSYGITLQLFRYLDAQEKTEMQLAS